MANTHLRNTLHPRNINGNGYDFDKLIAVNPDLKQHILVTPAGKTSIDFSNPNSVFELNKSLLMAYYNIQHWSVAKHALCPPIPGRADYIHYLADLLAEDRDGQIPTGTTINVLDIGVGSSCIYPILGERIYQWNFVGTDINQGTLNHAQGILKTNTNLRKAVTLRLQENRTHIFKGIIQPTDYFDAVVCNPPFFKSREDNWTKTSQKFNNLHKDQESLPVQNFGGQPDELWCDGGERKFIRNMIYESRDYSKQLGWVTSLVSDKENLKPLVAILEYNKAFQVKVIPVKQGNKIMRILAWKWEK